MNEFLTSSNIVGIDIGNLTTVAYSNLGEFIVESRVGEASKMDEFVNEGDIFGFNNQILVTNSGTFENDTIKFKKSNFLTLLNLAIAKTTDRDNVSIVIGIPAGQYSSLRDEMKQFILENNNSFHVIFTLSIEEDSLHIPMRFRIVTYKDRKPLTDWWDTQNGGAAESDTVRLGAGESKSYLLEWQWPYESGKDGIDTNAGKADLDYRVRLKIWAQQEGP